MIFSLFLAVFILPAVGFAYEGGLSEREVQKIIIDAQGNRAALIRKVQDGGEILKYYAYPEHPIQGDAVTIYAEVQTDFTGQELVLQGQLDGISVLLQQPSPDLFILNAGTFGTIGKHTFAGSIFIQSHSDAEALRQAIAQENTQIVSLQAQIAQATDPTVISSLQAQLAQAQNEQAQLTASLANLKTAVATDNFDFYVGANTTSPNFPHISGISPNIAHVNSTTSITITGSNFPSNPVVTLAGQNVVVSSSTSSSIVGTAPAFTSQGAEDLVVAFASGGQASNAVLEKAFFVTSSLGSSAACSPPDSQLVKISEILYEN